MVSFMSSVGLFTAVVMLGWVLPAYQVRGGWRLSARLCGPCSCGGPRIGSIISMHSSGKQGGGGEDHSEKAVLWFGLVKQSWSLSSLHTLLCSLSPPFTKGTGGSDYGLWVLTMNSRLSVSTSVVTQQTASACGSLQGGGICVGMGKLGQQE